REALDIAGTAVNAEHLLRAYANLAAALEVGGRFAESSEVALAGVASARQHGTDRTYACFLLGNAMSALHWLGRWDEIERVLADVPEGASFVVTATNLQIAAAVLRTAQGRFDEAESRLRACWKAYEAGGHTELRGNVYNALSELDIWRSQPADAVRRL